MRRLLILFFALLIPLQLSLAAVRAMCMHEPGATVAHPGHHEHQHPAEQAAIPDPDGAADMDCSVCHDIHQPAPLQNPPHSAFKLAKQAPPDYLAHLTHPPQQPPERPQWRRPA